MVLNKVKKIAFTSVILLFISNPLFATSIPAFRNYVNDNANVISSQAERELNEYLGNLENQTGVQIAVLTMPSLDGEDITSFAIRTCDEWGIGKKGKDNGVLLLLAMEERDVRIEVGYGLEDKLTDVKCGLIMRNVIIPEFRQGDYSAGLVKGVKNIAGIATDDAQLVSHSVRNEESDESEGIITLIFWLIFFFIVINSKGGLFKWIFLNNMLNSGRKNHRYYNSGMHNTSFRSGGFSGSSGFGGSGFHGGGGGRFGGGGATGHF